MRGSRVQEFKGDMKFLWSMGLNLDSGFLGRYFWRRKNGGERIRTSGRVTPTQV